MLKHRSGPLPRALPQPTTRRDQERPTISADPAFSDLAAQSPGDWIVAISATRDRSGFVLLFRRFAPKVKSYFLRYGLTEETADELAQETLLTIWRKAHLYDPARASASGWIYAIARNLRIDAQRRERRPRATMTLDEPPTPEQECTALLDEERVRAAVGALPDDQSEVVRMAFFEECSHGDIAQRLGLPLGTVKSRIRRAALRLRSALDDRH